MKYIIKLRRVSLLTLMLVCIAVVVQAQLSIKEQFTIPASSFVFVGSDVYYDTPILQNILLNGSLEIKGNWYNIAADKKVFTDASTGVVLMNGGVQTFNGVTTRFPNVTLGGTGRKQQNASIEVNGMLDLGDKELDVNGNLLTILSTATNAINYDNGGYVNTSSNAEGWLVRNVLTSNSGYVYPLGNNSGYRRFRPLLIAAQKDGMVYAQFQNYNPGNDSYSTNMKAPDVEEVYAEYYHSVKTDNNNALTVGKFYNSSDDGEFNGLVQWNMSKLEWAMLQANGPASSQLFSNDKLFGKADKLFTMSNLQVSNLKPARLSFGKSSEAKLFIPNVFTPNGDGLNQTFHIEGIEKYAVREIVIVNRWGNEVYKSSNYGVDNEWDGSGLNEGVYFYVLKLGKTKGGPIEKRSGYVHIIRN